VILNHGVPLKAVSEILVHLSIVITGDVYGHVALHVSRGAMDGSAAPSASKAGLMVIK
jgi:site-specific recombinase XerD